jgi:hypothetical protein
MIKQYDLHLPVFKQGDDLAHHLERNKDNPIHAFRDLAAQYECAAKICKDVAKVLATIKSISDVEVQADTHFIGVSAPEKYVRSLVEQEILVEENYDEI